MIKSLSIIGLRGFAAKQTLELAVPNGRPGSGLTLLVGANNAGKSTALEALRALATNRDISFTRGRRNERAGDYVEICATFVKGQSLTLQSVSKGSSETKRDGELPGATRIYIVPSRRTFTPSFGKDEWDRDSYSANIGSMVRALSVNAFSNRLFAALKKQDQFNKILARTISPVPSWTIDQEDNGNYFVKISTGDATHSSEGAGEGFISLLFLVDAFYESPAGEVIVLDEPELSLHPAVQRRLSDLITEYSADRQIVIATHSPYFVNIDALGAGARLVRVFRRDNGSEFAHLSVETGSRLYKASRDMNNPHMMGLDAREVFFQDDGVVIVEGQEDVVNMDTALASVGKQLNGSIFGWGAGGAEKIELVASILSELGFRKVVGLLDANKEHLLAALRDKFKNYHFQIIPANDIRTKLAVPARVARPGLLDEDNKNVRADHREAFANVVDRTNDYLSG